MANTDTISDMLTRVRNAVSAMHETVDIPLSKIRTRIAEILKKEGYINSYEIVGDENKKQLRITLKYGPRGEKIITGIKRISKQGLKVYTKAKEAPRVFDGLGVSIISTSKGLKTDREVRKENIGGEIICQVW